MTGHCSSSSYRSRFSSADRLPSYPSSSRVDTALPSRSYERPPIRTSSSYSSGLPSFTRPRLPSLLSCVIGCSVGSSWRESSSKYQTGRYGGGGSSYSSLSKYSPSYSSTYSGANPSSSAGYSAPLSYRSQKPLPLPAYFE